MQSRAGLEADAERRGPGAQGEAPLPSKAPLSPLVEELKARGFGIHYDGMLVPCLLYADDLVLIAESTEQLRAMMLHTSLFCRKWRFKISRQKTHVVIYGPRRTLVSQDQVWTMAGMNIDMRQSYKYLGIHYENKGGWDEVITHNTKKAQQSMGQLLHSGVGDDGLQIEYSARLWKTYVGTQLLYGAEIWSPNVAQLKDLETILSKGARNIFGRKGNTNVSVEALLGDLGWLSIESQLVLAKTRFFERLCNHSKTNRLTGTVFLAARHIYNTEKAQNPQAVSILNSWCHYAHQALHYLSLDNYWNSIDDVVRLSATNTWSKLTYKRAIMVDWQKLQTSAAAKPTGRFYMAIKQQFGFEQYLSGDRTYSRHKFALRSRSLGLRARTYHENTHGPTYMTLRICTCCTHGQIEDEVHFILDCAAYTDARTILKTSIETELVNINARPVWLHLCSLDSSNFLTYLLGRSQPQWDKRIPLIIDHALKPYLLAAIAIRTQLSQT